MNKYIIVFSALLLAVVCSPEEVMERDDSETFTQFFPLSQRAFFYYPTGAGGYFNRPAIPSTPPVDFIDNPFETAVPSTAQDMIRPAAFFVPASDLLTMPYPSKIDQEDDEKSAMKHLEMLKELHDQLENNEQRFMGTMPSFALGGNAVTMPTNSLLALLKKFTKTVTRTVLSTVSCSSSITSVISTTNTTLLTPTTEAVIEETTEMTTTTTSTPSVVVTTITSTII